MAPAYGGDDITEFLAQLLLRASFPYKELNLNRAYEWDMLNELKEKICVLSEVSLSLAFWQRLTRMQADVGLNLYNFDVRRPGKPTHKYSMRLFDEIILAPYVGQVIYSRLTTYNPSKLTVPLQPKNR